jgi:hypothetical protein
MANLIERYIEIAQLVPIHWHVFVFIGICFVAGGISFKSKESTLIGFAVIIWMIGEAIERL